MAKISEEVCKIVTEKYLQSDSFQLIAYNVKETADSTKGLLGASYKLWCKLLLDNGETIQVSFFLKSLPFNKFHRELAINTGAFLKETFFYKTLYGNLKNYFLKNRRVTPNCYFVDEQKIILENLEKYGYRTTNLIERFDLEHCKCALKSLAEFHASSFLFENAKLRKTLYEEYDELKFNCWFCDLDGHPGHKHMITTIKATKAILDKHFSHLSLKMRKKITKIMHKMPEHLKPSKFHRNCLSHLDLWCNNIMFKYNGNDQVEDAVLVDFQIIAYNPPALDLLMLLFLNSGTKFGKLNLKFLLKHYYSSFTNVMRKFNENPEKFLKFNELIESIYDSLEPALCQTIAILHFIQLPVDVLSQIIANDDRFKSCLFNDRNDIVLKVIDTNEYYKNRLFEIISELIDFVSKFDCNSKLALEELCLFQIEE